MRSYISTHKLFSIYFNKLANNNKGELDPNAYITFLFMVLTFGFQGKGALQVTFNNEENNKGELQSPTIQREHDNPPKVVFHFYTYLTTYKPPPPDKTH